MQKGLLYTMFHTWGFKLTFFLRNMNPELHNYRKNIQTRFDWSVLFIQFIPKLSWRNVDAKTWVHHFKPLCNSYKMLRRSMELSCSKSTLETTKWRLLQSWCLYGQLGINVTIFLSFYCSLFMRPNWFSTNCVNKES